MGGSYREALAKVQSDRRYAEITASFNGLNLRSEYPALSREEHGAIIRVAKQVMAEAAQDPDPLEVQPHPTPPTATVTPTPAQPFQTQPSPTAEPERDQVPATPVTAATLGKPPEAFIDASEAPPIKTHKKTTVGLITVAALAVAVYVTIDLFWTSAQPPTQSPLTTDASSETTDTIQELPPVERDPDAVEAVTSVVRDSSEPEIDDLARAPSAEPAIETQAPATVEETREPLAVPDAEPALTTQTVDLAEEQPIPEESAVASDSVAVTTPMEPPPQLSAIVTPPEPDAAAVSEPSEAPQTPASGVALARQPDTEASNSVTDDRVQTSVAIPAQSEIEETVELATSTRAETPRTPPFNADVDPDLVRNIQRRLRAQGFDPGPIDGIMGWRTHRAIRAYQLSKGIPVDGEATALLLGSLVSYSGSRAQ